VNPGQLPGLITDPGHDVFKPVGAAIFVDEFGLYAQAPVGVDAGLVVAFHFAGQKVDNVTIGFGCELLFEFLRDAFFGRESQIFVDGLADIGSA